MMIHSLIYMNDMREKLLQEIKLRETDAIRLIVEGVEGLGTEAEQLDRVELIRILREVIRLGISSYQAATHTVSLEEAAHRSLESRAGLRAVTRRDLRNYIRRILRVEGAATLPLRSASVADCRRILQTAFGSSRSSYVKGRAVLSSIFNYGIRQEWSDTNPVSRLEVPRIMERYKAPLSETEVKQLFATTQKEEFLDMRFSLHLLVYEGVRPAEVARIQPDDICWQEKQILIRARASKTGGGRLVPLRHTQYLTPDECRIPRNWQKRWRALRRAAGFSRWVPDACRHTFASYHAAYFRNLPQLQLEMGHRDVNLLRSRYVSPALYSVAARFWNEKGAGARPPAP